MFVEDKIFSLLFFCFWVSFSALWVVIYIAGVTEKKRREEARRGQSEQSLIWERMLSLSGSRTYVVD